jgi:hypothetical protein
LEVAKHTAGVLSDASKINAVLLVSGATFLSEPCGAEPVLPLPDMPKLFLSHS